MTKKGQNKTAKAVAKVVKKVVKNVTQAKPKQKQPNRGGGRNIDSVYRPKPMQPTPKMSTSAMLHPGAAFAMTFADPGCIVAPAYDDAHQLPSATAVASGSQSLSFNNNATDNYLIVLRTALSGLYSASPATQLLPWTTVRLGAASTVGLTDLSANAAGNTWVDVYGSTTTTSWIFPWATKLQLIFNVPPSVQQGQFYTGNLPAQQIIGRSAADLIRISDRVRPENGRPVTIKNTLVELGNFHSRPSAFPATVPALDPNERLSYIIISPNPVGTLNGLAPLTYQITLTGKTNYAWLPVYDPAITRTLEEKMKRDMDTTTSTTDMGDIRTIVESSAAHEEILPQGWSDKDKKNHAWMDAHADEMEAFRKNRSIKTSPGFLKGLGDVGAKLLKHYTEKHGKTHSLMGSTGAAIDYQELVDPIDKQPMVGYCADAEYYLNSVNTRWLIDTFPPQFQKLGVDIKNLLSEFILACKEWDRDLIGLKLKYPDNLSKVEFVGKTKIIKRFDEQGSEYKPERSRSSDTSFVRR